MRFAGSSSWSTDEGLDEELHRLLHVRQALVGRTDAVLDPPLLRHQPPAVDVPVEQVPAALEEWGRWWRSVLVLIALRQGHEVPPTDPALGWAKELCPLDALLEEGGPVDRYRLTDPVLDAVARQVEAGAHRWWNGCEREAARDVGRGLEAVRRGSVPWAVTREVAPGAVLCSFDAALHPVTSRAMLRHAFTARL